MNRSMILLVHSVEEDLRLAAKTEEFNDIRIGYVERSANISFVKKEGLRGRLARGFARLARIICIGR